METATLKRLDARSRQTGQTRSRLAKTFIEEGLRMEAHPGIVFRPGPVGRRPALAAGPDVWELIRFLKGLDARGEEAVRQAAKSLSLTPTEIQTAIRYYADYGDEIDAWIGRVEERAEREEAAWLREQGLLA